MTRAPRWPAVVLLALAVLTGCAAPPAPAISAYAPPPPRDDAALLAGTGIRPDALGYLLIDAESGETVEARKPDDTFIPASTAKILTTVAALGILGPDHRFETVLATNAPDGTIPELQGDLYLVGGGDPLLAPGDLMVLAERLADAGVTSISGGFYVDDSRYPNVPAVNPDQPTDAVYNAGVSALSLDFNRRRIAWQGTDDGTVGYWQSPPTAPGEIPEAALSRGAGAVWLPVDDPTAMAGETFRALARLNGIELPEPIRRTAPVTARRIAGFDSEPLGDIARAALEHSNNVVAELIGLETVRTIGAWPKSLDAAADVTLTLLRENLTGADWSTARLPNHSGLSARARLSPRQTVAVLRFADKQRYHGRRYRSLLPASGWREAFDNRLSEPETAMRVWAKTGTMRYATGIAGYLIPASGRPMIFALYVTDFTARADYDALAHPRADAVENAADDWRRRAKSLEAEIIRRWALTR